MRSKSTTLPHTIVLPALRENTSRRNKAEPETTQAPPAPPAAPPTIADCDDSDGWDAVPCSLWPCTTTTTPEWDTDSIFAPALTTYSDSCSWF